jgi:hypothetical protein
MVSFCGLVICTVVFWSPIAEIAYSSYRHIHNSEFKLPVDALKDVHEDREEERQCAKDIKDSVNQWEDGESEPTTHYDKVDEETDNYLTMISSLFDLGPWWGTEGI